MSTTSSLCLGPSTFPPHAQDVCPEAIAIVVGNKIDLDNRRISYDQGSALADSEGALFFEVSAKSGLNVSGVFEEAAKKIVASR